jgi:hypothetical protein
MFCDSPPRSLEPVGRLHRLRNLRLLEYDDWIFVPICQDPTPMTEDMLAEQAEVGGSVHILYKDRGLAKLH